jgi:hypothetical protein
MALPHTAGNRRPHVVHLAVAVIVPAITDLGSHTLEWIAGHGLPVHTVVLNVQTLADTAGGLSQTLVYLTVAVVVSAVTHLVGGAQHRIARIWLPVDAPGNLPSTVPHTANVGAQFIRLSVTVVVQTVADLHHGSLHGVATLRHATDALRDGMITDPESARQHSVTVLCRSRIRNQEEQPNHIACGVAEEHPHGDPMSLQ